jgi:uncharacterized membrane protein
VFDLINGLPWHPLVVHAVVVLLPLAVVGALLVVAVPRWRRHYGPPVVAIAVIATILIPVATASGEALEKHVGRPGVHAELGEQLIWFALALLVPLVALLVLDHRRARGRLVTGIAALTVVAALALTVQVYRVGDSGARAAWADQVTAGSPQ